MLPVEIVGLLRDLSVAQDRLDQHAAQMLGLNRTDQRALDVIGRAGTLMPSELARSLGMSTGATSAVLDRLERAGYAVREPDPHHRRHTLVRMTPRAEALCAALFDPIIAEATRQAGRRSDAERDAIGGFLADHAEFIQSFVDAREASMDPPVP
jgi:DNA-binding MarR family transcriptional regulator